MTGLDTTTDRIIEVATVVTDSKLTVLAEGPELIVHQPDSILEAMDEWNTSHHTDSGLIEAIRASTCDAAQAERETVEFLKEHVSRGRSPMCGNSICQDRRFLAREMPELESYFHYRNLDVSSIKELAKRWRPDLPELPKSAAHRALSDVHESIRELAHYREHFFRMDPVV